MIVEKQADSDYESYSSDASSSTGESPKVEPLFTKSQQQTSTPISTLPPPPPPPPLPAPSLVNITIAMLEQKVESCRRSEVRGEAKKSIELILEGYDFLINTLKQFKSGENDSIPKDVVGALQQLNLSPQPQPSKKWTISGSVSGPSQTVSSSVKLRNADSQAAIKDDYLLKGKQFISNGKITDSYKNVSIEKKDVLFNFAKEIALEINSTEQGKNKSENEVNNILLRKIGEQLSKEWEEKWEKELKNNNLEDENTLSSYLKLYSIGLRENGQGKWEEYEVNKLDRISSKLPKPIGSGRTAELASQNIMPDYGKNTHTQQGNSQCSRSSHPSESMVALNGKKKDVRPEKSMQETVKTSGNFLEGIPSQEDVFKRWGATRRSVPPQDRKLNSQKTGNLFKNKNISEPSSGGSHASGLPFSAKPNR